MVAPLPPAWESEYLEWMRSKGRTTEGKQMPAELGGDSGSGGGGGRGGGGKKGGALAEGGGTEEQQDKGKWRPAPRETEADRTGDVTSLRRHLDRRLFLVLGAAGTTATTTAAAAEALEALKALPSAEVGPGETTRASAERALAEAVPALSPTSSSSSSSSSSGAVEAYFVGNAPAGHFGLPGGGEGGSGGTLFFHRAQLVAAGSGDLLSAADSLFRGGGGGGGLGRAKQHAWLTREELAERLGGGELGELVKAML